MRKFIKICAIAMMAGLLFPAPSYGFMSSSNYTIFADSIDSGGVFSAGGTYSLEDTLGESPADFTSSSIYEVRGGYQAMDWATLSMEVDTSTVDLGVASISSVSTGNCTATINTDADTGYNLSITNVTGTHLADVTDGTVSAGSEEYGLAVSGTDALFSNDQAIAIGLNLSSSSTPVTDSQTLLTFKAAIMIGTTIGTRSQTITLTASANI